MHSIAVNLSSLRNQNNALRLYTSLNYFFNFFFFFNWLHHLACRILVPWSRIEPMHPALEALNLNHWTTREVLHILNSDSGNKTDHQPRLDA